jgi:hypothetical protein
MGGAGAEGAISFGGWLTSKTVDDRVARECWGDRR